MLKVSKISFGVVGLWLCMTHGVLAQNTYSPYSVLGIGELQGLDLVHNMAMGGVGISNPNPFHLNNKNPALLPRNRVVVFETAVSVEQKRLSTTDLEQDNFTGGLGYLAFGFPVIRDTWTISAGLMPYSIVNYKSTDVGFVTGTATELNTTFEGGGGISQAYFASGLKLFKGISVGFRASYLFGSIRQETVFDVAGTNYLTADVERNSFSDVTFGLGAAYTVEIRENQSYMNFGITYEFGGEQGVTRLQRLERRGFSNDPISPVDEPPYLVLDDIEGNVEFPATLGLGISYEKSLKWTIAADLTMGQWSNYLNFEDEPEGLNDRTEFAIGGSYIPDAFSVSNYLKRVTYMMGLNYQTTPYLVDGEEIQDFGINFGVTFPLRNLSRLSLAFKVGQRGTTDNDLIQERYFKASLGITVNDNKWFIRRKFD